MKKPTTVRGVLLEAARLLERRGWCQREFSKGRRLCARGAINVATTGDADCGNALSQHAMKRVRDLLGVEALTGWNDQPGRRKRDVVAALRKAAR